MTKMNPEVKKLWVDALRSGDYKQTRGALTRIDGDKFSHCCLGVLCEVAVKAGVLNPETDVETISHLIADGSNMPVRLAYAGAAAILPRKVREWAGIASGNPLLSGRTCSGLNDDKRLSFSEIANLIETEL